jgi:hypothetical protein
MLNDNTMITHALHRCMAQVAERGWQKIYFAIDIHGTILHPTYAAGTLSTEFYPQARAVLQYLSMRKEFCLILYTCSHPDDIRQYLLFFRQEGIHFQYVNENPEVLNGGYGHYERKFYFNVLIEDKAGFDPLNDWSRIADFFQHTPLPPEPGKGH